MDSQLFNSIASIAAAIIGLATIAVLVSGKAQTGSVIQAATGGFAQDLAAAVSPVTGGSSGSTFGANFGGGAGNVLNF